MQCGIPYTARHFVNLQTVLEQDRQAHDPFSLTHVNEMNHPVEIGEWQQGVFHGKGHFYELQSVKNWIEQPRPAGPLVDPLTGLPFDWHHVDTVEWERPGPPHLQRTDYVDETETFLKIMQNPAILPQQNYYQEYLHDRRAYRQRMAELSWADGGMDWIPEYWQCHAYSANDSHYGIRVPNLARSAVQGRPGQMPVQEMERQRQNFRLAMAQKLDAQTLERPIALEYWKYHPLDTATDAAEVVRAYHENEAKREVRGRRRQSVEDGRYYIDLTGSEPVRKVRPRASGGGGNIFDG